MNNLRKKYDAPNREARRAAASYSLLIAIPVVVTIILGLVGWSTVSFDRKDPLLSAVKIVVLTLSSFNLSTDYKSITEQSNWFVNLSAFFGSLTTFAGVIAFAFVFSRERLLRFRTKYVWTEHVIVVGDTPLASRLASRFRSNGNRVVQVGPVNGERSPTSLPIGFDASDVISATRSHRARLIVVDLETDAATLAFGQGMLLGLNVIQEPDTKDRPSSPNESRLALKVEDQVLSEQFLEFVERYTGSVPGKANMTRKIRPMQFDEYRTVARYTLARYPLFVLASQRNQRRVHAVILGANDLAERLVDQVLLTSIGVSLDVPLVTILDRDAARREQEFRARRPGVIEQLPIRFVQFDIDIDLSSTLENTAGMESLFRSEAGSGVTAIYVAFNSESESLRAALLLRRYQERTGDLRGPIFYYQRPSGTERSFVPLSLSEQDEIVAMQAPIEMLVNDILDLDGREDLARASHENYRRATPSHQSAATWEMLPDSLRRANIRAADQIPALLWSLGVEVREWAPGELPNLNPDALAAVLQKASNSEFAAELSRVEHERWMIERKLDGWSYGPSRDDQKRHHPLLIPWEQLRKSPAEVRKDFEQVSALLRSLGTRRPLVR
ncbi:RyR domain-containing protein [Bradyrhizobium sp. McL0615]|uniref:RyR domain-containing protein n=1 Tax=Bradyrhizobium sp. McL0615 TaxID=3415673 RepID=UPI003CECCC96